MTGNVALDPITFILNPAAGKGKAGRVWQKVSETLKDLGQPHILLRTSRRGEASLMAADAQTTRVVAVGGDGTIQEVANGLIGTGKTLGIIPGGSGNDLIKSLGIPQATRRAVDIILAKEGRTIDVGQVSCSKDGDPGDRPLPGRYFVNGVGVGFDAAVAARTQEIPWLTGTALYLAAVFQTLGKYKAPLFRAELDGEQFEWKNLLIAVGNGRCAGGGFFLTPEAELDDGLLDICSISQASVPRILTLMPWVMKGKHGQAKEVKFFRAKSLRLSSESSFYVHADGELVGRSVHSVEMKIIPGALKIFAPARSGGGGVS